MKTRCILLAALFLSFQMAVAEDSRRVRETEGGFSYTPVKDWSVQEFPGMKFKIVLFPPSNGFASNLNFVDEKNSSTLEEYATWNIAALTQVLPGFELLERSEMKTTSGTPMIKIRSNTRQMDRDLFQVFYLLELSPGTKMVVTGTSLRELASRDEPAFDAMATSLEAIQP